MQQVQQIKNDREKLEKELKEVNCDLTNDFLKAMAESQLLNEEAISKEKIAQIYGPLKERVNASIKQQEDIMADVEVHILPIYSISMNSDLEQPIRRRETRNRFWSCSWEYPEDVGFRIWHFQWAQE